MMSLINRVPNRKSRPFQMIIDVKSGFQSLINNTKKLNERLQELNPIATTTEKSTTKQSTTEQSTTEQSTISINSLPSTKLDILITITEETSTVNVMVIMYILLNLLKVNYRVYKRANYKSQGLLLSAFLKAITTLKNLNLSSFFTNLENF